MGGRFRCGSAGDGCPSNSRRTLWLWSASRVVTNTDVSGAWAAWTQTQLQLEDLQQSGVGCFDLAGSGSAMTGEVSAATPLAC